MKFPQIATYFMALLVCCLTTHAQTKSLTTVSTGVYLKKEKSITQATQTSKNHKTLFAAVKATDLASVLETNGPFTVFAPSDNAFSKFTNEELKDLFKTENAKILTYVSHSSGQFNRFQNTTGDVQGKRAGQLYLCTRKQDHSYHARHGYYFDRPFG